MRQQPQPSLSPPCRRPTGGSTSRSSARLRMPRLVRILHVEPVDFMEHDELVAAVRGWLRRRGDACPATGRTPSRPSCGRSSSRASTWRARTAWIDPSTDRGVLGVSGLAEWVMVHRRHRAVDVPDPRRPPPRRATMKVVVRSSVPPAEVQLAAEEVDAAAAGRVRRAWRPDPPAHQTRWHLLAPNPVGAHSGSGARCRSGRRNPVASLRRQREALAPGRCPPGPGRGRLVLPDGRARFAVDDVALHEGCRPGPRCRLSRR